MQNQDYYIGTNMIRKRENIFINLIQKFIDEHWNVNFISFLLVMKYSFNFFPAI